MEHKTDKEDQIEEFVDCTDVFIDKIIEDCITDPFPDLLPVACGDVKDSAGLKTQGYVNVNLNQNDQANTSTFSFCEKPLIPGHLDPMFQEFGLDAHNFDLLDENISLIRRSQSDDLLSGSISKINQESLQRSTNSEKNIRNLISPTEISLHSTFPKPFNGWTNDDASSGSEVSSDNIDFSAEFEHRIDLLESADFALEEAFFMLRGCIEKLRSPGDPTTEHLEVAKEQDVNLENVPKTIDIDEETANTVTENIKVNKKGGEEDMPKEEETKQEESRNIQDNKIYKELLTLIVELESKFEHFTTEVGDLVQLGAFSVKHAVKVEQFTKFVKSMYVKLRMDNENMQEYIHDKEAGWLQTQAKLHSEIVRQTDEIQVLMTELSNSTLQNRIRRQMQDRHLNPGRKETSSTENIVNLMLHQRCSVEKAMALDFSRQSKINELKLLVLQQQSYIQKLELQNKEMEMVIQGMLSPDDEPKEPPKEYQNVSPLNSSISMVSDVLFCDHAPYLVDKSTDCSLVSEQVFQIGNSTKNENRLEAVFDPQRLSYVRNNIREQEVLEAEPSLTQDVGSGESGGINGIPTGSELEEGVQESKQKVQEPDELAPAQDNM